MEITKQQLSNKLDEMINEYKSSDEYTSEMMLNEFSGCNDDIDGEFKINDFDKSFLEYICKITFGKSIYISTISDILVCKEKTKDIDKIEIDNPDYIRYIGVNEVCEIDDAIEEKRMNLLKAGYKHDEIDEILTKKTDDKKDKNDKVEVKDKVKVNQIPVNKIVKKPSYKPSFKSNERIIKNEKLQRSKSQLQYGDGSTGYKYIKIPLAELVQTSQYFALSPISRTILLEMIYKSGNDCLPIDFAYSGCDTPCSKPSFYRAIKEITDIGFFIVEKRKKKETRKQTNHFIVSDKWRNNHTYDVEYSKYLAEKKALCSKDREKF